MVGVGFLVLFAGYSLLTYGWSQIQGSNTGLIGIVWPGAFNGSDDDPPADIGTGKQSGITVGPGGITWHGLGGGKQIVGPGGARDYPSGSQKPKQPAAPGNPGGIT